MRVIDQHMHSSLSIDSDEPMEAYIEAAKKRGDSVIVTTEHMDLESCLVGRDVIPDFELQQDTIRNLSEKCDIEIRMGIEIGYKRGLEERHDEILGKYPFDVVLLSIHESSVADVGTKQYLESGTAEELYSEYLDLCIEAITSYQNYEIFGHIDYFLRYIHKIDITQFEDKFIRIFKGLIENGKALEFNTRFYYDQKDSSYLTYIYQLYQQCGGEYIALGSDCHQAINYKGGFEEALGLLKEFGFKYVCQYKERKMEKYRIE